MDTLQTWKNSFSEAQQVLEKFLSAPGTMDNLKEFSSLACDVLKNGGTIFTCGNGGSHCDALHFAEEFTGRYRKERRPLGALALGEATHMSCVANDIGFEHVFARQLQGLGRAGDMLVLLSTSGNSPNL